MATRRRQNIPNIQEDVPLILNTPKPKSSRCLYITSCPCICLLILSFIGLIFCAILISFDMDYSPIVEDALYRSTRISFHSYDSRMLEVDKSLEMIDAEFYSEGSATLYRVDKIPFDTLIGHSFDYTIDSFSIGYKTMHIFSVQYLIIGSSFSLTFSSQGASTPFLITMLVILEPPNQMPETVYSLDCYITDSDCIIPLQLINKTGEYHFGVYCHSDVQYSLSPDMCLHKAVYSTFQDSVGDYAYCDLPCSMQIDSDSYYILTFISDGEADEETDINLNFYNEIVMRPMERPYWYWILLFCSTLFCILSATSVTNICIAIYIRKSDNRSDQHPNPLYIQPNIQAPPHDQNPPRYTPTTPLI